MTAPDLVASILFSYFFLRFNGVLTVSAQPICAPSSCGHLRDITYPFRLADAQPEPCGLPGYELICEGNRTVWNLLSGKYYVRNISYEASTIRVVDVSLASGSCRLPSQSLPPRSFYIHDDKGYDASPGGWAAFVNCSRKITDTMYKSLACMSGGSSAYVYLVHGNYEAYQVQSLQPSCHPLSLIPLGSDADEALSSGAVDVEGALQMGFEIRWYDRGSKAQMVRVCLRYAFRSYLQDIRRQIFRRPHALAYNFFDCFESNLAGRRFSYPGIVVVYDYGIYIMVITIILSVLHVTTVLVLVGRFIVAPLSVFVLLIRRFQEERAHVDAVEKFLQRQEMLMPTRYAYPEIVRITNHFEKKVGQGGFGSVFQGKLPGGYLVAVKMLSDSKCNGEEFISEVSTIGRIHHTNIMPLIGFCSEGANRALVYDYMPNGSLDRFIFPSNSNGVSSSLCWERLNEIALGIARGIEYLHRGCDMCILHFDIKPHNILLDYAFQPKVSDFGLAKLYPKEHSLVSLSVARGTVGYIAPELISRNFGTISHKSDVYSFGMLLLEVAGARKKMDAVADKSSDMYFPTWIYDRLNEERVVPQQVDGVAEIGEIERKLCIVGLWCIQMKPSARPSMSDVIEMLQGSAFALPMPPKPFFSSPVPSSIVRSCMDTSTEELSVISEEV